MKQRKEIKDFYDAYKLWEQKGKPEMTPVLSGKGPFSSKLSMSANYRLFYLYNPKYVRFDGELK